MTRTPSRRERPWFPCTPFRSRRTAVATAIALLATLPGPADIRAQEPAHLRDRGPGVSTSMFGTYVSKGQLLLYPFAEWYRDNNLEYKPSELGYSLEQDYRGRYRATEGLMFVGYGLTRNLAIEMEVAVISAELTKSPGDPSSMPRVIKERGLGDVEGQLRWRWQEESSSRPEGFAFLETVFPSQRSKPLIGTSDFEYKLGVGFIRGYAWGTMTVRAAVEYSKAVGKAEAGEYAVEYLKRLSPRWRIAAMVEGNQVDEVALIAEVQWHLGPRAMIKLNNGFGLTPNATDIAPECGVMFSLGR
ncbi:MAG: hypothetical protein ACT4P7_04845 [Gemmatimonadaceae bacterium]